MTKPDRPTRCAHCGATLTRDQIDDSRDARAPRPLCPDCLDIAVWAGRCALCEREPARYPCR